MKQNDHRDHDHETGTGEYVRLGLIGIIVVVSLTGWWRPFMDRDWDTLVLDKTGTLTMGIPEVTGIRLAGRATENEVLQNAAIAEQHSEHPLGEAIISKIHFPSQL